MLRIKGYVFEGSKPGGFWTQAATSSPSKLGYRTSSGEGRSSPARSFAFRSVSRLGVPAEQSARWRSPRVVGVIKTRAIFDPSGDPAKVATSWSPDVIGEALPVDGSNDSRLALPWRATLSIRLEPSFDQTGRLGAEPRGG